MHHSIQLSSPKRTPEKRGPDRPLSFRETPGRGVSDPLLQVTRDFLSSLRRLRPLSSKL